MSDPIQRGKHWAMCYNEEGGLKDLFLEMRMSYFQRAAKLPADMATEQRLAALESLSIHADIVSSVEEHVIQIIATGKVEEARNKTDSKIEDLPMRKQNLLRKFG